ncbi:polysaccharide biosynthesis tyrosine autokinase [Trinickia sp. LjRoot230]|uniref:polysaccharide biosynthesis tyrosine autokinase n=1 Tax=Trinickia sp. LjRoot230 TaxID=3342288 RepID=UPI003ECDE277
MKTSSSILAQSIAPPLPTAFKSDEDDVVLGQLLHVVLDDIGWLIGIAATVIALAALYCFLAKPIYTADAHVRVQPPSNVSQALTQTTTGASTGGGTTSLPTDAEIEIIKSRGVVAPVVEQFKLNFSVAPKTIPLIGNLAERLATPGQPAKPWLGLAAYAWGGEIADVDSLQVAPELEGKQLTMTAAGGDHYTLRDGDGDLLLDGEVGRPASGGGVTIFVKRLVARAGTRFTVVRMNDLDAITGFQAGLDVEEQGKQTGVIQVSIPNKSPERAAMIANAVAQSYLREYTSSRQAEATKMLDFLQSEAPRMKTDLEQAEAALSAYQAKSGSINPSEEAKNYLEGSIQYEQQISALQLQLDQQHQRYGPSHPAIIAAEQQLARLRTDRDSFSARFRNLPAAEVKGVALKRDAKVAEDIYELLLNRVQELSVQKAGTGGNVHLIDPALRPGDPTKPKKALILSAAAMLGLIAGTGVVFMRRNLMTGIDDPERVERACGLPLYGLVPTSVEGERLDAAYMRNRKGARPILALTRPNDSSIESLRSLRTSMQFAVAEAKNSIMVLTGPAPGIGKSFMTANLAVLFADSGKRVLAIDADMRRGTLHEYFGGGLRTGLAELLAGQIPLEDAIRKTPVPSLDFIACGTRPTNPSELLMSQRLEQYLEGLAKNYDVILVDTPPLLAVTDAAIIASHAGTSFVVLRSGMHAEADISDALKRLAAAGAQAQGGIFNAVPPGSRTFSRSGYAAVREYLNA